MQGAISSDVFQSLKAIDNLRNCICNINKYNQLLIMGFNSQRSGFNSTV